MGFLHIGTSTLALAAETGQGCGSHHSHLVFLLLRLGLDRNDVDVVDVLAVGLQSRVYLQSLHLLLDRPWVGTLAAAEGLKLRNVPLSCPLLLLQSLRDILQFGVFVDQ